MGMTRVLFTCDLHGGESVWMKFLNSAEHYKADFILVGGDLTGKAVAPIVELKDGTHKTAPVFGKEHILRNREEIEKFVERCRGYGIYPYESSLEEISAIAKDQKLQDELFERMTRENMERWLNMADERVDPHTEIILTPGNDDSFIIDDVIERSERVMNGLDKVLMIGDYSMISMDWVNPTPWNSPRECPEKELEKKLKEQFAKVDKHDKLICNFHSPPFDSRLDTAEAG